jgi:uncharacterized lipoprotein YajG
MENTTENQITVTNQITVADLNLLKNIVDLASTRGAFRASEMQEIGAVFNRLNAFLEDVVSQAQADSAIPTDSQGE